MGTPSPSRLIVLQQHAAAGRALARWLAPLFAQTVVTPSPAEAERLLGAPGAPPTALVCGQRFAEGEPCGSTLITRWRARCPCLGPAVLVTAEPADELPERARDGGAGAVDAIFLKPFDPRQLRRFFAAGTAPAPAPARARTPRPQSSSRPPVTP